MLQLLSAPPVSLVGIHEIKNHLRLDHSHDDSYLESLISVATAMVEEYCGQSLLIKKWRQISQHDMTKGVAGEIIKIFLRYPPLVDIESVFILDEKGQHKQTKRYYLNQKGTIPFIEIGASGRAIEVTYTSGYGVYPANINPTLRHSVLLVASQL